jgi:hypothetical protein
MPYGRELSLRPVLVTRPDAHMAARRPGDGHAVPR